MNFEVERLILCEVLNHCRIEAFLLFEETRKITTGWSTESSIGRLGGFSWRNIDP